MEKELKALLDECLQCKNPTCLEGCLANNNIKEFIRLCKENKIQDAFNVLSKTTTLPSICSLVCPSEKQCQGHCIKNKINKPVNIPFIEHYIATNSKEIIPDNLLNKKEKIAIIGSGPAGLACAEILAKNGYNVDIYDQYDIPGGILTYGIPEFVLNKKIVNEKINYLKKLKINFLMNLKLGKDFSIDDLLNKYDAIFLAIGACINKKLNVPNENLKNIVDANYFLEKMSKHDFKEFNDLENIAVIGGGNTAIDAALSAKKYLNSNVSIVYRRSEKEMPARIKEINKAKNEQINFLFLTSPISFIGKDKVNYMECVKNQLVLDGNNRPKPVEIENSNFKIKTDLVIKAISFEIDTSVLGNILCYPWSGIIVNENMQTSIPKIFAGGDCTLGPSLVVIAMKQGMNAAYNIIKYLS